MGVFVFLFNPPLGFSSWAYCSNDLCGAGARHLCRFAYRNAGGPEDFPRFVNSFVEAT
jgi:hypothetical protein